MTTSRLSRPVMFRAGAAPGEQPPPPAALAAHPAVVLPDVVLMADISEFQPDVNDAMYLAWSQAVIIRAAYGARHDDRAWFGGQRRDLLHAGGVRFLGIYQYVVAGQDVAAQAREFCRLIGRPRAGEYYLADIEEGSGNLRHAWNTWTTVVVSTLGAVPCGNYSGRFFARDHGLAPVDWIASYGTAEPPEPHLLWQFTDAFDVPGIGRCDCSVFHGSIDQLASLGYQPPANRPATTEDDMPSGLITSPAGVRESRTWPAGRTRQIVLYSDWQGVQAAPPVVDLRIAHLNSEPFDAGHKTVDGTLSYDVGTPADCNGCAFTRIDNGPATVAWHTNA